MKIEQTHKCYQRVWSVKLQQIRNSKQSQLPGTFRTNLNSFELPFMIYRSKRKLTTFKDFPIYKQRKKDLAIKAAIGKLKEMVNTSPNKYRKQENKV